jgi:hypothetical protein
MLPQLGAGGCWPRPRKDRLASAMTAGPSMRAPGARAARWYSPASRQASALPSSSAPCMRTVASGVASPAAAATVATVSAMGSDAPMASTDAASITSARPGIRKAKRWR